MIDKPSAYYFGYRDHTGGGHFLWDVNGNTIYDPQKTVPPFPERWTIGLMDTGFLNNGKYADIPDGRVFWTCGAPQWSAFFWWDRSGDRRANSNSGFYVYGFEHTVIKEAFAFACGQFPQIVQRQTFPLQLIEK